METPPPTDTKTNAYRELELFVAASLQGDPEIAGQAPRCRETGDEGGVTKLLTAYYFIAFIGVCVKSQIFVTVATGVCLSQIWRA